MCREDTPTLDTVIPEKTKPVGRAMIMGPAHVDELGMAVASAMAAATTTKKVSEIIKKMTLCFI